MTLPDVLVPTSLAQALSARTERPDAVPLAGGTTLMPAWNRGGPVPPAVLDLSRVDELRGWDDARDTVRIGALSTYAQLTALDDRCPALAQAAAVIGSPQIRNVATLGGCIAVPDAAGDVLPALLVEDAAVELARAGSVRRVPLGDYLDGDRARPDELITAVIARAARGPESFLKVGRRNAATAAIVSVAVGVTGDSAAAACRAPGARASLVRGPRSDPQRLADRLADANVSVGYGRRAVRVLVLRGLERCTA